MQVNQNRLSLPLIKTQRNHRSKDSKIRNPKSSRLPVSIETKPGKKDEVKFWKPFSTLLAAKEVVQLPLTGIKPVIPRRLKAETGVDMENVVQLDEWRPINNSLQQRSISFT